MIQLIQLIQLIRLYNCGAAKKRARCMFSYNRDVAEEYHSNLLYRYYTVDTIAVPRGRKGGVIDFSPRTCSPCMHCAGVQDINCRFEAAMHNAVFLQKVDQVEDLADYARLTGLE